MPAYPEIPFGSLVCCTWFDGVRVVSGTWRIIDPDDSVYRGPELDWDLVIDWMILPEP